MTWNSEDFIVTTFSFVFLITTVISYIYSDYPHIIVPLVISVLLTLGFNMASVFLHLRGAWRAHKKSLERKTHIAFAIIQFILTIIIILLVKALNS